MAENKAEPPDPSQNPGRIGHPNLNPGKPQPQKHLYSTVNVNGVIIPPSQTNAYNGKYGAATKDAPPAQQAVDDTSIGIGKYVSVGTHKVEEPGGEGMHTQGATVSIGLSTPTFPLSVSKPTGNVGDPNSPAGIVLKAFGAAWGQSPPPCCF